MKHLTGAKIKQYQTLLAKVKLDLDKIQSEILTPTLLSKVEEFGNGTYRSKDEYGVRVVDGVVVTVLE